MLWRRTILFALTVGLLTKQALAQPVEPPFRSPQELMAALKRVYDLQDKGLYWRLHCWSNVSPQSERVFKATSATSFKATPADNVVYDQFTIHPAPAKVAAPRESKNGTMTYNLPVEGIITFRSRGGATVRPGEKPIPFTHEDLTYFGCDPAGNYWLAVEIFIPKTKAPSTATTPGTTAATATNAALLPSPDPSRVHRPVNLSTPEATIRSMIQAYCSNNVETAARCMDFPGIASIKLRRKYPPPAPEAIAKEAARFEQEWRETFQKHGLPDYRRITISSIGRPTPEREGGFRVDCNVRGPKAIARLVFRMSLTQAGWKFIFPPNRAPLVDDTKPFPTGMD